MTDNDKNFGYMMCVLIPPLILLPIAIINLSISDGYFDDSTPACIVVSRDVEGHTVPQVGSVCLHTARDKIFWEEKVSECKINNINCTYKSPCEECR